MNAYRIYDTAEDTDTLRYFFRHTLADAHIQAKRFPQDVLCDVRIELVELSTNAKAVLDYLNGGQPTEPKILRTWKLTPRGGLVELDSQGKPLEKETS